MLPYTSNYAPNFEEAGGPYCFRVVRACICSSRFLMHAISYEPYMLRVLEFHTWIPHGKIADRCFFLVPVLSLSGVTPL